MCDCQKHAKKIGIYEDGDLSIDGQQLNQMSDEELDEKLTHISVYARVAPEHKIRIVKAWQKRGDIVAMTGDGVNDAQHLNKVILELLWELRVLKFLKMLRIDINR